jgi:hypothetical protein
MTVEADEPRKRRTYTTAERLAILKTADKVGAVEAARHHGVPQKVGEQLPSSRCDEGGDLLH